jgi:broad specificity phosphatase PhoE
MKTVKKFSNQIYVARHGQSQNNLLGLESGNLKTQERYGLTDLGRAQVSASASKYPDFFDFIYTSPFRRTRETAEIFARFSKIEYFENPLIREFEVGFYDQKPYELMEAYIHHPKNHIFDKPVRGGESWLAMHDRLVNFIQQIEKNYEGKKILIVSHGSPIEAILQFVRGEKKGFGAFSDLPKNAEVIRL